MKNPLSPMNTLANTAPSISVRCGPSPRISRGALNAPSRYPAAFAVFMPPASV